MLLRRTEATRVSSHAIKSEDFKHSIALSVMSFRFPIGVLIIFSNPGINYPNYKLKTTNQPAARQVSTCIKKEFIIPTPMTDKVLFHFYFRNETG
jgi:hypothetical protein